MNLLPVTIVDDFFKNPDYIRSEALKLNYEKSRSPGLRAICPANISELVSKKIFALLIDMNKHIVNGTVETHFQLTTKDLNHGWVHNDVNGAYYFAGVIYLTPNAPLSGGTSMYKPVNNSLDFNLFEKLQENKINVYTGKTSDLKEFNEAREKNNNLFYKTVDISNIYNRLVMYPVNEFHSENKLFGETKEDARLTLVFFVTHIESNSMLPIDRMKSIGE